MGCPIGIGESGVKKHVSPHSLRHAYATHLVEAGVELTEVQDILGHHSLRLL
ncbi:MAG TPA: tyrosine-type recombinase/integrase [Candidatus Accumulibacter phosphatis]|nr:tyrosine-type recombinase/integrase [Candidatus Accumulibacter phosphatis]